MHNLREILGVDYPVDGNLRRPGPKPLFTDMEVIALSLTSECLGIDSELYLFNKIEVDYSDAFPDIISRRQYNDRRKSLFHFQEAIRKKIAGRLNVLTDVFAVDSMPIEICKLSRAQRNKIGKEEEYTAPSRGYCASQNKYFFGYKLHTICSASGVIEKVELTKASIHDVHFLKDIGNEFKDCTIIGDRGYINKKMHEELKGKRNIRIEVPYRSNQKEKEKILPIFKKIRKRVETLFSQLCGQFMIQRNYAKSYTGFKTRILAKISGMTVLQYINKFINNRPIGQIKYALI